MSDKWIKASIIGTIWAAAEIVLGSFLHNLHVPFCGNILTAIALVILISVSYRWREHGLYWRAGLICALMKTMSPSAVIFGPMIAITMESVLLEIFVSLFGKTYIGFILGSMLAMSWNLFQKVFNIIIFYGGNLVDIYSGITSYASKLFNLHFNAFWAPLIFLLVLYALFGAVAAITGISIGRRMVSQPAEEEFYKPGKAKAPVKPKKEQFNYSLWWLLADVMLIAGLLAVVGTMQWFCWVITVVPAVTVLALRYKRVIRQLSKPGFWIAFVLITMLSALVFTALQPGKNTLTEAILIGVQMNFRAIIIIVGFSVLGTELYNPKIRSLFNRTRFRQLPLALELSASSLPMMIADMPDLKTAVKKPVKIMSHMMSRVEKRINEECSEQEGKRKKEVFIVTGSIGAGKTAWLVKLTGLLRDKEINMGGILALRIIEEGKTTGYDVSDIVSGERAPFLRLSGKETASLERFTVIKEGFRAGQKALDPVANMNKDVIIIDEAGPFELKGMGWSRRIEELLNETTAILIIAVRKGLTEEIMDKFGITGTQIIDIGKEDVMIFADKIALTCTKS